jgi:GNAT superfamily N-acetyltransferase
MRRRLRRSLIGSRRSTRAARPASQCREQSRASRSADTRESPARRCSHDPHSPSSLRKRRSRSPMPRTGRSSAPSVPRSGLPPVFASWFAELVGRDRWHCFVAHADGTPVATGAVYVAEDVGSLGFAATRQEERGQGAQQALLAARLERASSASRRLSRVTGSRSTARRGRRTAICNPTATLSQRIVKSMFATACHRLPTIPYLLERGSNSWLRKRNDSREPEGPRDSIRD